MESRPTPTPLVGLDAGALIKKRFRVLAGLSSGSRWVRYLVQDGRTGTELVLELRHEPPDEELKGKLLARYQQFAELDHPNIVSLYEAGLIDDELPYSLWEMPTLGQSLRNVLTIKAPLRPTQAVSILLAMARGLQVIHRAGHVHGHLAPENVVLVLPPPSKYDWLRLSGLLGPWDVRSARSSPIDCDAIPDVYRPEPAEEGSVRGDLFALGVILFEMLVAALPLRGFPPDAPAELRPSVPEPLSRMTLKLLGTGDQEAYRSIEQLLADLERDFPRFFQSPRPSRLPMLMLLGLLGALLSLIGWLVYRVGR